MVCPKCGRTITEEGNYCPGCGHRLSVSPEEEKREKKTIGRSFLWMGIILAVVIAVALIATRVEIASGKISFPSRVEDYIGVPYNYVELELRDAGFSNIETRPLNDLSDPADSLNQAVYKMVVNNRSDYWPGRYYPDVSIIIYYHSVP